MKLHRIIIRRMPGIDDEFSLDGLSGGLNLIVGPNGSGKTTLRKAVRAVLWPSMDDLQEVSLKMEWSHREHRLLVRRDRGLVRWQRDGVDHDPPRIPPDGVARCFSLGVGDLMLTDNSTDSEIAQKILRQMAGGYDARAVADEHFALQPNRIRKAQNTQDDHKRRVRKIKERQEELAEQQERLRTLENELREARRAGETLDALKKVRELLQAEGQLRELQRGLDGLPEGMALIRGGEIDLLQDADANLEKAKEDLNSCRMRCERAEKEIADCRLPAGPVDSALLKACVERAHQLQNLQIELNNDESSMLEAENRLSAAMEPLGTNADIKSIIEVDQEALQGIDAFMRRTTIIRDRRAVLEAERGALAEEREGPARSLLEDGKDALDRWLAAAATGRRTQRTAFLTTGVLLLIAGAALGTILHWSGWLMAGAGLGIIIALLAFRPGAAAPHRRTYEETELAPPEEWSLSAVRERRRGIEDELASVAFDLERKSRLGVITRKMEELELEEQELQEQRERRSAAFGLDPGKSDLDLADYSRTLFECRSAEWDLRVARAAVEQKRSDSANLLGTINTFLRESGELESADVIEAIARIDALSERNSRLLGAQRDLAGAASLEKDLEQTIERFKRRIAKIYEGAGLLPGERKELEARLERLADYQKLEGKATDRRAFIADIRGSLSGQEQLLKLEPVDVERRILDSEGLVSRIGPLSMEIGSIDGKINSAQQSDELERGMAELAAAESELSASREELLRAAAGRFLLRSIHEEYDQQGQPEVLKRARKLFRRFTDNAYELILDHQADPPLFRAIENSTGEGKSLSELSDGTRIQLLLAARAAFAAYIDQDGKLPLFLDEVLTTSDPHRFLAIARSLAIIAREERRQVFYLTSNPTDAGRWNAMLAAEGEERAAIIDLAAIRGAHSSAGDEEDLALPAMPRVPSPEGLSAEEYGAQLQVPAIRPFRRVAELHLFHLLREDLALLYELLKLGMERVGVWQSVVATGRAGSLFSDERAARLSALIDVAESFLQSWRIGRGCRVNDELLQAGPVSDTFLPALAELARRHGGEPAPFMRAVEEKNEEGLKGFGPQKIEKMRSYLTDAGCLDEREILDEEGIRVQVLAAVSDHIEAGRLAMEDVVRLVHQLYAQAGLR